MSAPPRHSGARRLLAIGCAAGIAATAVIAAPATARPLDQGKFTEEFSETVRNFCDVPGLTIDHEATVEGKFLLNTRKPGTAPYFGQVLTVEGVYTNADGDFVSEKVQITEKDLKITVNDDGTLTILVLATGNATVWDASGKAIARNPGQVRYEILIDYGTSLADPTDDVFIKFVQQVKGSTGRSDDFCEAVLPILG